ncbi:hypothetical protein NDU88_001300 [Pleurodeles waltl]|uniref:Uncharacterized protein n=1 Tax=Pleurodeles waltl TaxID=8319 RepID=A0AAV7UWF5_PLEWA|nr:hypothetical protein NDU88_001300 [Pleurodeles waltl]
MTKGLILSLAGGGSRPPSGNRQKTVSRSKDRGGHSGFPTGLAGDRQKSARQPSGKHPSHEEAGSEWSRRSGKVLRVQLHPSRISVSAKQTLKFIVGPSYGGPCSAHAIGMGTAGAPRGPTTPHTAILFLAGDPPGTGWRYGVSESPWRRSKLRRHGGFPWAAESRRYTAGFPLLAAECPAEHRQPVGGATADPGPGGIYRQGQNDPLSVLTVFCSSLMLRLSLYDMKPLLRPAQFEALAVWELVARQQQELKFNRRMKRVEKSLAEARWDWEQKRWGMATMKEIKMFPSITEGDNSDKGDSAKEEESEGKKKRKKSYVGDDDSDVEDLITQLLRDRPPPMTTYAGGRGISVTAPPATPGTSQGAAGAVQAEGGQLPGAVQSTPVAGTSAVAEAQVHTPSVPRVYPDVPVLETVSNIVVPREQVLPKPMLVQTDPTPML